jgi:CheY-like chemotaxis protein
MTDPIVYIVDDDSLVHYITRKMLAHFVPNENVLSFYDGKELYEFLDTNTDADKLPDYILLDIHMPNMNGLQFLNVFPNIQSKLPKLPSIYVISSSMNKIEIYKVKSDPNVKGYITKPLGRNNIETIFKN